MTRPVILIATPCFGGTVTHNYMLSVVRLMNYAISRARSTLLAAFLDDARATRLLFVDADISFEPQQVERLLKFD
jgi:hypothetical protein